LTKAHFYIPLKVILFLIFYLTIPNLSYQAENTPPKFFLSFSGYL